MTPAHSLPQLRDIIGQDLKKMKSLNADGEVHFLVIHGGAEQERRVKSFDPKPASNGDFWPTGYDEFWERTYYLFVFFE